MHAKFFKIYDSQKFVYTKFSKASFAKVNVREIEILKTVDNA